jgi:hypothetical protein
MSNENNLGESEVDKSKKSPLQKSWKEIVDGIKGNFNKFQNSLEKKAQKNQELWKEDREKVTKFLKDLKQNWNEKVETWSANAEKMTLETKEQWNSYKNKIEQDFETWQEQTRKNWDDGLKTFRRGFLKTYLWALLLIIPVLIVIVVVLALVNKFI